MQTTEMYAYSDIFMFGEQFLNFVPIICLNDVEPTYLVTLLSWRACFIWGLIQYNFYELGTSIHILKYI